MTHHVPHPFVVPAVPAQPAVTYDTPTARAVVFGDGKFHLHIGLANAAGEVHPKTLQHVTVADSDANDEERLLLQGLADVANARYKQ